LRPSDRGSGPDVSPPVARRLRRATFGGSRPARAGGGQRRRGTGVLARRGFATRPVRSYLRFLLRPRSSSTHRLRRSLGPTPKVLMPTWSSRAPVARSLLARVECRHLGHAVLDQ